MLQCMMRKSNDSNELIMNPSRYLSRFIRPLVFGYSVLLCLTVSACSSGEDDKVNKSTAPEAATNSKISPLKTASVSSKSIKLAQLNDEKATITFETVKWDDLIPKDDLEALVNPPSYIADIEDGSFEDQISSQMQSALESSTDDRYQQALVSTKVIDKMNEKFVKVPGFVVPLEHNDEKAITEFFLVPFFGACVHVPPPPPNQIIFVRYPKGLLLEALYDPVWISGLLTTSLEKNEMATAAYTLDMRSFEPYVEEQ